MTRENPAAGVTAAEAPSEAQEGEEGGELGIAFPEVRKSGRYEEECREQA